MKFSKVSTRCSMQSVIPVIREIRRRLLISFVNTGLRNMLGYFITSFIVYFATLILFSLPACCKRNKKKKEKRKSKSKNRKHRKTTPELATPSPVVQTPVPIVVAPPPPKMEPFGGSTEAAAKPSNKSKEPVEKEEEKPEEKKSKKSEKSEKEDVGELLRCRDYTPENLAELKHLFDLLD